jgi:hypothetical protein
MAARRPVHRPLLRTLALPLVVPLAGLLAGCGSDSAPASTEPAPTTIAVIPPSVVAGGSTTAPVDPTIVAPTSDPTLDSLPVITMAPVTVPGTASTAVTPTVAPAGPPPSTSPVVPSRLCPGITTLPAGAVTGDQITGNLDGDGLDDTVTAYTAADGIPHVFVQRGSGNASDAAVPISPADHVSISFEDVDHALGAAVPPPLVVLAIGAGPAGSAVATFLSLNTDGCLQQWQLSSGPFTFLIDQRGPFSGLLCDGAAGRRFYVLRTATPDGAGNVVTSSLEISHTGVFVTLARLGDETIPDDPSVQHNFGDILNCDHPPIFPQ